MSTLLEKQIRVNRIVTTSVDHAKAIEDPSRAKILEILYHKQLTVDQISSELKKAGYNKALTTTRHHLEILRESGLVEIVKIMEARGAVQKFYGTSTKFLGYQAPKDFDSKYSAIIKTTATKLDKLLQNISKKTASPKKKTSTNTKGYDQYILLEIVNHAITNVLEERK